LVYSLAGGGSAVHPADKWGHVAPIGAIQRSKEAAVNKAIGMILIVLGLVGLVWGGFAYTTRERVVDIGPLHATREKTHNVPLTPLAGAVALIGGVVLLVAGGKK
jgi:drug/metabolite transporter (DMT)-like permease